MKVGSSGSSRRGARERSGRLHSAGHGAGPSSRYFAFRSPSPRVEPCQGVPAAPHSRPCQAGPTMPRAGRYRWPLPAAAPPEALPRWHCGGAAPGLGGGSSGSASGSRARGRGTGVRRPFQRSLEMRGGEFPLSPVVLQCKGGRSKSEFHFIKN